jgi:hypothetical protein
MFTRNICVVAKDQAKDFLNILGEDDVDELAQ